MKKTNIGEKEKVYLEEISFLMGFPSPAPCGALCMVLESNFITKTEAGLDREIYRQQFTFAGKRCPVLCLHTPLSVRDK